jgi:hypothetical protein
MAFLPQTIVVYDIWFVFLPQTIVVYVIWFVFLPDSTSFLEDLNTRTLLHTINVTDPTGDPVSCTLNPPSAVFDVSIIPSNTGKVLYVYGI